MDVQTYQANPLPVHWIQNVHTPGSQWITVVPAAVPPAQANVPPAPYLTASFNYELKLTNIPIGSKVTLSGLVAADDNATISTNGSGPYFSNKATHVVSGNYANQAAFSGVTFIAGATNDLIVTVTNVGQAPRV